MESLYLVPPPAPASLIQSHLSPLSLSSLASVTNSASGITSGSAGCWALSRNLGKTAMNVLNCLGVKP